MEANVVDPENVYHNVFRTMLAQRYPTASFRVVNSGKGGESAAGGRLRLERDVITHAPDLLLLGYCLNDACAGMALLPEFRANMAAIIEGVRARWRTDIIMLTPNFMATTDSTIRISSAIGSSRKRSWHCCPTGTTPCMRSPR